MKLSAWAKQQGLTYKTAWRMWRDGKLPIPAEQLPTGTVIVHPPGVAQSPGVALYARVSSADQRADLDRQLARLSEYAARSGLHVVDTAKEVGSGLNGHRKALMRILRDPKVQTIVVEHRDRLMRFGFEYVEAALAAQGRRVLIVDADEVARRRGARPARGRRVDVRAALRQASRREQGPPCDAGCPGRLRCCAPTR